MAGWSEYLVMNDWQRAEQHADRALDYFDRGRLAEAEHELRQALSIHPDQPDWHFNLGLTLEAGDRDSEALERFERTAALAPDQLHPILAAASVSVRLERWDRAKRWYDRGLKLDEACEESHAGMIESWIGLGEQDEAEAAFYLAEWTLDGPSAMCLSAIGRGLMATSSWKRAEWCLREALRLEPELPDLRGALATVLSETGRADQALAMFNRVLRETPDDLEALYAMARLLNRLRRGSEAIEKLEQLLRLDPLHLDAHELLADIAAGTGHHDRAIFEFQLVLRLHHSHGRAMLGLAESLLAIGRLGDTGMLLKHLFEHREQLCHSRRLERDSRDRLADLLLAVGKNAEAATAAAEGIDHAGATAERHRRLALASFRGEEQLRGWTASRRALRMEPGCVRSLHNLTLASLQAGRLDLATIWLHRGLGVHPRDEGLRRLRVRLWLQRCGRLFGFGRPLR